MEVDYVAFTLCCLFFILFLLESMQLTRIFWQKNKIVNYRNGIVFTLSCADLLRFLFWLKVSVPGNISPRLIIIVFCLPVWLNFAALSQLTLFYAYAVFENYHQTLPRNICIGANFIFFCLNIVSASLITDLGNTEADKSLAYGFFFFYSILLDSLTAILIGYFGYHFVKKHYRGNKWILPRSVNQFSAVNWIVVICVLLRGFFVILVNSAPIMSDGSVEVTFNGSHQPTSIVFMIFFVVTEIIPNSSILYLLWRSRSRLPRKKLRRSLRRSTPFDFLLPHSKNFRDGSLSLKKLFFSKSNKNNLNYSFSQSVHYPNDDGSEYEYLSNRDTSLSDGDLRDQLLVRQSSGDDAVIKVIYDDANSESDSNPRDKSVLFNASSRPFEKPGKEYTHNYDLQEEEDDYNDAFEQLEKAFEGREHQHTTDLLKNPITGEEYSPASVESFLSTREEENAASSWIAPNVIISSLYNHNARRINPTLLNPHQHFVQRYSSPSLNMSSNNNSSNSSLAPSTNKVHLDPSAIFTIVEDVEDPFRDHGHDIHRKYTDTVGPRDILRSTRHPS